ncbi:MAG: HAMP domain-containing sensor histidine kinase [Bacteroidota bacterium]|nr:HAMP domain-containing sensor histidine kinase [Bacteroidota bacterium]
MNGKADERECRISGEIDQKTIAFDLSVKTQPFEYNGDRYVFFSVIDISDTKRKEILERTFLHDVLNTAGGVYGFSGLLKDDLKELDADSLEKVEIIYDLSDKLVQEIKNHQRLRAAEKNDLIVDAFEFDLKEFMQSVINIVRKNRDVENRQIILESCENAGIFTDRVLLQRILINMIKNAAEASRAGEVVSVMAASSENGFLFSVHNPGVMSDAVRRQIFQRSFSTKGSNRGTGTYSMKLFGENYLKGKVWFESDEGKGTTFFLELPGRLT